MLKVSCTWQSICFSSLGFVTVIQCFIIVKKMLLFTVQCTFISFNINTEDTLGSPLFYVMSKIIVFDAIYLTEIFIALLYLNKQNKPTITQKTWF